MTQQNPGQPYIPPSASSGSGAYNPQQYQAQTSQYQAGGATSAASAQYQTGAQAPYQPQASFQQTGQQFAVAPPQDSFFTSLMDTSRSFVDKFGRLVFLLAAFAILVNLIYGAYNEGRSVSSLIGLGSDDFNALQFLLNLLANIPWALVQIGLVRMFIELVRNTSNRGAAA
ncbi:hypothetical protein [Actinomyces sp. oral taxon 414]|uniref:hypothetical protein n=1 Tax=Actinomyces sp. oral taxon 414 TaxID=712122 RepID=UPI0006AE1793|nr:hypothetical protein [Actinomyces sp. oral taxon 414]